LRSRKTARSSSTLNPSLSVVDVREEQSSLSS
jgi:hypothetical protein